MITKEFAASYERTPEGWIIFPADANLRKAVFYPDSIHHPAKLNIHLCQEIYRYVSNPGDVLLDPMSGTGTLMLAAAENRTVMLIEDAAIFHHYQQESLKLLTSRGIEPYECSRLGIYCEDEPVLVDASDVVLLYGPCQDYLPMPCDHVIFSPPYSSVVTFEPKSGAQAQLGGGKGFVDLEDKQSVYQDYKGSPKNLSRLNPFFYNQAMEKIYRQLWESIIPGGTLSFIVQDMIQQGKRVKLTEWAVAVCVRLGFELELWVKRWSPGTGYKKERASKGYLTVMDEDIVIMRRPEQ